MYVFLKSEALRRLNMQARFHSQSSPVHMGLMGGKLSLGDFILRAGTTGLQVSVIQFTLHVHYSTYRGRYINIANVSALIQQT